MQERLDALQEQIDSLEERHVLTSEELVAIRTTLDAAVKALKLATDNQNTLMKDSKELLEIYKGFKATVKIFGVVERIATWIAKVAVVLGICWAIFKYGVMEALSDKPPK